MNWWLFAPIIRKLQNSASRGRHMKGSFKYYLTYWTFSLFLFLGPVFVPETTETVITMTDVAVTITESTQLESTTSLSPSEVKSTKSTCYKWTLSLKLIFSAQIMRKSLCQRHFVAHVDVQGHVFLAGRRARRFVKREGVSGTMNKFLSKSGKILLAVRKTLHQFRWSCHLKVRLRRWPCYPHSRMGHKLF